MKGLLNKEELVLYLIKEHRSRGRELSRIKLQKALYFLFAFYGGTTTVMNLADEDQFNTYLFDANFEAWAYGPVDREVYFKYKRDEYSHLLNDFDSDKFLSEMKDYTREFVEDMVSRIFNTSDFGLVNLSHEDTSWSNNFDKDKPTQSNKIDNEMIINEYAAKELN